MTKETNFTPVQGEREIEQKSRTICKKELRIVDSLLNSLLDGFNRLKSFTSGDDQRDRKHLVHLLYITRSFNSLRSALALAQLGYYSQAIMLLRSVLEDLLICQSCERDSALVERLLEGKEEKFNFAARAKAEDKEFAGWWQDKYDELSTFTHPRSPGLQILISPVESVLRLGPYFDRDTLLAVVHYLLMLLIHYHRWLFPILRGKDTGSAEEWAQHSLKNIRQANTLIKAIAEQLEPEGRLAMKQALSAPDEEATDWEEYKKQRAARVRNKKG